MNPKSFLGMISDISDEYIVSAANPHNKTIHWYQISAVAACVVLLIAAVIYPKLRTQTPETVPPAVVTETTTRTTSWQESIAFTTTTPEPQTSTAQMTALSASVTSRTAKTSVMVTMHTTSQTSDVTASTGTTTPCQTAASEKTEPPQTDQPANTTQKQTKTLIHTDITTITTITTNAPQPEPLIVPLWKGAVIGSIYEGEPLFNCSFQLFSSIQPDPFFGLSNPYDLLREEFEIPQEYDLEQDSFMEISVTTAYKETAITGCRYTQNGLTLTVAYLENDVFSNQTIRYAIPIPENLTILPENCNAEYIAVTDESEYQALLTDSLIFELDY